MGSYLLLILVMGVVMYGYLNHTLENYLVQGIHDDLLNQARLARMLVGDTNQKLQADAPRLAATIGKEIKARVTIIDLQGVVLGDSEVKQEELRELENHLGRPEIQEALHKGSGSSIRYSATLRMPMLYVAMQFRTSHGESALMRLALPLTALAKTKTTLHAILGVALTLAFFVALVLSYILSTVTSRSLRSMTAIAGQIGRGEIERRIPVTSRDELGELAGVMNEMTDRIEGQLERLATERNRLDTILRGMGEGLMVTDARGVITLINPAFRKLFALREEVEGRLLIDITRHPALNESFRLVFSTKSERLEEIHLPIEGEKVLLTHWVPLLEEGEVQGVVAVFHDISDLKQLEKIRRDFVANVSHELRTPVTVIKGYAETLLDGALTADTKKAARFVEIIHSHSERLAALITDLLALSELESGDFTLSLQPTSVHGAVNHASQLLEAKAGARGIAIDCSAVDQPVQVLADPGRLEQIIINLLDNAVKYTPDNGQIRVTAGEEKGMIVLAVSDNGVGIPSKDLPRIFERFYRVDSARSREQGGTGLGLSIVKHLVQLHGGSINVESEPGKGSVFTIKLKKA
jgi:two-component system phosphate regulon sensor histidine kinase PhoR